MTTADRPSMIRFSVRGAAVIALVLALFAPHAGATGLFIVNQPWVRPAAAGKTTEAYMDLTSTAGASLVSVESADAASAAIVNPHPVSPPGKAPPSIALPPGKLIALAPGVTRITLRRLTRTLKLGDRVSLVLAVVYDDGSEQAIPVDAEVRLHSPIDDELRAHHHHGAH